MNYKLRKKKRLCKLLLQKRLSSNSSEMLSNCEKTSKFQAALANLGVKRELFESIFNKIQQIMSQLYNSSKTKVDARTTWCIYHYCPRVKEF